MHIPAPPTDCDPENRHLLCEYALEIAVQEVVAAAANAGWEEEEALVAISAVADHLMLRNAVNSELWVLLKELRKRHG